MQWVLLEGDILCCWWCRNNCCMWFKSEHFLVSIMHELVSLQLNPSDIQLCIWQLSLLGGVNSKFLGVYLRPEKKMKPKKIIRKVLFFTLYSKYFNWYTQEIRQFYTRNLIVRNKLNSFFKGLLLLFSITWWNWYLWKVWPCTRIIDIICWGMSVSSMLHLHPQGDKLTLLGTYLLWLFK